MDEEEVAVVEAMVARRQAMTTTHPKWTTPDRACELARVIYTEAYRGYATYKPWEELSHDRKWIWIRVANASLDWLDRTGG